MQIYLSYSNADKGFAQKLSSELSKRGCPVWDPAHQLLPGDNWHAETGRALKQSKAMIVLLSPDSIKSEWVRREIEYAISEPRYEGRLFPVVVRPTEEIPWILRKLNILQGVRNPAAISKRIVSALGKAA